MGDGSAGKAFLRGMAPRRAGRAPWSDERRCPQGRRAQGRRSASRPIQEHEGVAVNAEERPSSPLKGVQSSIGGGVDRGSSRSRGSGSRAKGRTSGQAKSTMDSRLQEKGVAHVQGRIWRLCGTRREDGGGGVSTAKAESARASDSPICQNAPGKTVSIRVYDQERLKIYR